MLARRWFVQVGGLAVLAAAAGCSGGNSGAFATVSGTVTQNNAPIDGAKVTFYSTTEVEGKRTGAYTAITDSSGKYLLVSVGKEPGIPPGMYKVTVVKLDQKGNLPPDFDLGQMEASGMAHNTMPKDYENPATTKLSVTLEAGKNENKNFELKGGKASGTVSGTP
jgi:hypothetical protein